MTEAKLMENLTPLMKQYEELKSRHPGEILLFRLGDFYEIFSEDAKLASPILEVTLTQRQGVPMCGVPYHAMSRYVSKLLKKNLRVAIAEQMEDPALAKGIVRREIVRVITPGTILEENLLESGTNNFLVAVSALKATSQGQGRAGFAALDVSTGQFLAAEFDDDSHFTKLAGEIALLNPSEVLVSDRMPNNIFLDGFTIRTVISSDAEGFDPEEVFQGQDSAKAAAILERHPWRARP